MRLLECGLNGGFSLTDDLIGNNIPLYAILSHRWGPNAEEPTYQDLVDGTGKGKAGYEKLRFCAEQARRDGLRYFWVDTCCIDKSTSDEVQASINSMFRWYRDAARCYVYLSDVSIPINQSQPLWEPAFRASQWFTRGWTLQELIAPASVEFFTKEGQRLGDKKSLAQQIHEVTGITLAVLLGTPLDQFDVKERFKWAETRQTTREEDWAYCLLGIFGVFMPVIYGEGKAHAVRRLKKEITEATNGNNTPNQRAGDRPWMVPFERNPSFTGRESELKRLRQALFAGPHTVKVAVTGLGGVGKTQLALEMVYRMRTEHKDCSVIWIPATTKESLSQAYLNAARQLGIPGWEDHKADVKRLVQDHLSSESAGQWILVFDNADDVRMWVDKSAPESSRLIDRLPKSSRGSIIFTTRDNKTAVKLAGRNVIEVSEMDEAGSVQLLRNSLINQGLLNHQEDATTLLAQLTYLPLAIVQAAVYINENRIGLADYLSLLEEQEEDVINLLSEDFEDEGRYREMKNPVATTWLISFEQVRQRDPIAADYLSFIACVDAKDIPQSLLPPGPSRKKETDAMGTLLGYSFIARRSADSAITIHRLVHLATRNWLRREALLPVWSARAIARLAELLMKVDENNRVVWRSYMPHAYYALESGHNSEDDGNKLSLLMNYGRCLWYDGRYLEAEKPFRQAMETCKSKFGNDHLKTLTSMNNLAATYVTQGRWDEAEKLSVQVMEGYKTKLGADHPDTLMSTNNLATTYMQQGRWDEAEKLGVQVMEGYKTKLGVDHPDTLTSMNNVAWTWRYQGRHSDALAMMKDCAQARRRVLGLQHQNTLLSVAAVERWNKEL